LSPKATNIKASGVVSEASGTLGKSETHSSPKATNILPMPLSLVKILVHVVFSTKNRSNLILPEKEKDLYSYIGGIVEGNKAKLIIANGTMNHSHFWSHWAGTTSPNSSVT
jgi:hypothetical protein